MTLLRGNTYHLTALTPEDHATITQWYQDTDFIRLYDGTPARPQNQDQIRESYGDINKTPHDSYRFAIRRLDAGQLIGTIAVESILWNNRTGWVSIAIGNPSDRGKGAGTEAMRLLMRFAFHELNLYRLQLTVFSYNRAAINLYEKLGFTHEGTYREFIARDGHRYDMLLFGLLVHEWSTEQV